MNAPDQAKKPCGGKENPGSGVLVWDLPIRVFHWSLVGVVALAAATAFWGPEWWLDIHVMAGYALGLLLAFRMVWGLAGGRHSRFTAFPLYPAVLFSHLRSLIQGRSSMHAGHNPAGAWMILGLLTLLSAITVTGIAVLGGRENLGPLAALVDFETGNAIGKWHEILTWGLVACIAFHLAGVLMETRLFRHPVVGALITGRKPVSTESAERNGLGVRRGLVVFSIAAIAVLAAVRGLAALPGGGWRELEPYETYRAACGECHHAHHPSLREKSAWRALVAGLSSHFGEDATLDEETAKEITRYLEANDAATFDTEAANMIGHAKPSAGRITETEYWKKRHHNLEPALFDRKDIGSRANCDACHEDAASGRFDDHAIRLPKGDR